MKFILDEYESRILYDGSIGTFTFNSKEKLTCDNCDWDDEYEKKPIRIENIITIYFEENANLSISKNSNVQDLVKQSQRCKVALNHINPHTKIECNSKLSKTACFLTLPKCLILHIARFSFQLVNGNNIYKKKNNFLEYNFILNLGMDENNNPII